MTFEQYVKDGRIDLSNLHSKTIGDLIDFVNTRPDIEEFDLGDHDTSHNMKSRRGNNISNNMKLRCIGAAIGLVAGLVAACYLGQDDLTQKK